MNTKGLSLPEVLVSVAIVSMIVLGISAFQRDVFVLNSSTQNSLSAQMDGRRVLRNLVAELRTANRSSTGSFPIAQAATSTITFYANIDNDAAVERVRYWLQGTELRRSVLKPTGSPLTYIPANEVTELLIRDMAVPSSQPIFEYFNSSFAGTTTPLQQPVNPSDVTLVRATVVIERDPNRSPVPVTVTTQVMIRNLKTNQ